MQHVEVSGVVRHIYIYIYIYVVRQLRVKVDAFFYIFIARKEFTCVVGK